MAPRTRARRKENAPDRATTAVRTRRTPRPASYMLTAIALIAIVFIAYLPALSAPFEFDDVASISDNVTIRRLWPPSIPLQPPSGGIAVAGRPIVNYSLALNYAANKLLGVDQPADSGRPTKPAGYRVVNILLHLLCGALLFGVVRRTLRSPTFARKWAAVADIMSATIAALWLLHPIQTEAVDYVIQRTELIVSLCWLATLYASIRAWDASGQRSTTCWYAVSVGACLLGMGSKEVMITAPLIVMLYDRAFRLTSWRDALRTRGRVWLYVLLVATSGWAVALIATGARADSAGFNLGVPWYRYLYSQAWAIGHYLGLVLWPHPLTLDYGQNPVSGIRPLPGLIFLTAFGVATIRAWVRVDRWGWFGFLGAWFFLLLAPSSSFVPIRSEIAAERRIYLALAAVLVLVVVGCVSFARHLAAGTDSQRQWAAPLIRRAKWFPIGTCALLAVVTFSRSQVYANPEALWREVVSAWPENARGYNNLGKIIVDDPRRFAEGEALFNKAIAIDSTLVPAWINLAYVKTSEGHLDEAATVLVRAVRIDDPANHAAAVERYGRVLLAMGDATRAMQYLALAASAAPTDDNLFALGLGYVQVERWDDATAAFRRVLMRNPGRTDALRYMGRALIEGGHADEALKYLEAAAAREPDSGLGLALLSLADAQLGRADDAAATATAAAAKAGNEPQAFAFAGQAMIQLHRAQEAQRYFAEAVRLNANDWQSLTGLGLADAELGNRVEAIESLRRALRINPGYPLARRALELLQR